MRSTNTPRARNGRRDNSDDAYHGDTGGAADAATDRKPGGANSGEPPERCNLYEEVTRRIVAELEEGRVPWVQPWGRARGASAGLPRNALTAQTDIDRPMALFSCRRIAANIHLWVK